MSGANVDYPVPAHAAEALRAGGQGVQIYTCTQQGVAYQWVLTAPEATLTDDSGKQLGTHSAGPTWTAADGSVITGKVLQKKVAMGGLNIPWLLLAATPKQPASGVFANVAYVRRSATKGGNAPADGCDAQHPGAVARVPYSATYTFYKAVK